MNGWRWASYTLLWGAARALDLAERAAMYLAAGTLRIHDVREGIARRWDDFGRSETGIFSGLMPWESAVYRRFLKPEDHVLVIGCGTGRDVIALLNLGHRVDGLDASAGAIELARRMLEREHLAADLYTGSIEAVALARSFDAVTFSWFCYSYIPQAVTRIAVLRKVKTHLNPGGRVFISYVPADSPRRLRPIRLTQLVARLTRSDWHPEPGDVIGAATGDRRAIHYEHQFSDGELEREAHAAGFTVAFHERTDVGMAVLTV